jgi:Leucine-rich repeat (LRR) protein
MKKASELDRSAIQKQSLIDFYESTGGAQWKVNVNWLSPRPVHTWYGVTCDKKGNILRLDIENNNLNGPIPESIGQLTSLIDLRICNNNITGTIPDSICELTNLVYFIANDCKLEGEIPNQIGKLTQLSILRLQNQNISGIIPESITRCFELEELDLFHNYNINSKILPDNLHELPRLKWFRVSDNGHIPDAIQKKLKNCLVNGIFWNDTTYL